MNCCIAFCLVFFIIPNMILMCVGGFMCATALIALFWPSLIMPAYKDYFQDVYRDAMSSNGVDDCYGDWSTSDNDLIIEWSQIPLAKYLLYVFVGMGGWLFLWSFWGFLSLSRCCHKCFLVFFTIVQIFGLIVLPVALLIVYVPFKTQVMDSIENSLNTTMERDYYAKNDKTCTSFKLAFDALQYEGYCCALDGYDPQTDARLRYSSVCSAGTTQDDTLDFRKFDGCFYTIKNFLDKECLLWLGISIGIVCVLFLIEIITGLVCVGLWRRSRSGSDSRSRNYIASERDGFISDKDMMDQYYAPGQFSVPTTSHRK